MTLTVVAPTSPPRLHLPSEIELLDPDFDSTLDDSDIDIQLLPTTLHYYEQPQLPEEFLPQLPEELPEEFLP